jgi:ELWxxDGT repeat protein
LYFYNSIFYNGLWKIAPDLSFSSVDTAFHVQTFLGKVNHKLIFNAVLNTDTFGVGIYTYDLSTGSIERVLSNTGVRVLGQQALSSNDSMAFFVGNDSISGNELWQTDGTSLNTFMDIDYSVGSDGSRFLGEGSSYLCGNFLYLALLPYTGGSGFHVWDGVSLSTTPLKSTSEDPSSFVEFNGDVFFMLNYYSGTRYSLYKFPCALINSADEILSSDFTVYPNPVMNTLKLKSNDNMEGGFVKISNAMGQCLKTSTLPSTDSFIEIDVSGFSSGIYFVEYLDKMNSRRSVMRFVKE